MNTRLFLIAFVVVTQVLVVFPSVLIQAQQATIFPFLRGTISARSAGLGGSTVAMVDDLGSVVLNPASIATLRNQSFTATFIKHVLDINSGFASYSDSLSNAGVYAVTASYTSYGSFERSDKQGSILGTFGASDVVLAASFAKELDTLITYGFTAKILYGTLDDKSTTAIAFDAALLFQLPVSRTNIGISLLNAGTQLSTYDGVRDVLPIDLRVGLNHRLRGLPLLVNVSLNHLTDNVDGFLDRFLNFSVGGELYLGKYIQARLGYDNATRNLSGVNVATQLTGVSGGVGVNLEQFDIDYALSSMGASALLHRISIDIDL